MTESEFLKLAGGSASIRPSRKAAPTISENDFMNMAKPRTSTKQSPKATGFSENDFYNMAENNVKSNPKTASMYQSFRKGWLKSATGKPIKHIWGLKDDLPEEESGWVDHYLRMAGEVLGDLPVMQLGQSIGTPIGGVIGGVAGSVIPGAGTVGGAGVGGIIGGGAGMLALPTLIKQSFAEYENYVDKGGTASFQGFLESAKNVSSATAQSGAMGGLFGVAAPALGKSIPILKKIPGVSKILNTKPGFYLANKGAQLGALTGSRGVVESIAEGKIKLPTAEQVGDDAALLFGMDLMHAAGRKAKAYTKPIIGKPKTSIETATQKAAEQARFETASKLAKKIVPESLGGKRLSEYLKGIPESRAKSKKLHGLLKESLGESWKRTAEHNFDWDQKQKAYTQKYGEITAKQGQDIMHWMQKRGNPNVPGDTFGKLNQRMTAEQKGLAKDFTKYFDNMLKENNKNPLLKKINPREAVKEVYLPGYYQESPARVKEVFDRTMSKLKIKNPAANSKTFLTLADAMEKGGLTPKYSNPFDLVKKYGQQQLRIQADTKLLSEVRDLQNLEGNKFIVHPESEAQKAEYVKKGYKRFDDPLLKAVPQKDGSFKYQSKPAYVSPEFASEMAGVFTQKGMSAPDAWYWKAFDRANQFVRIARVAISPFHYATQIENIAGQLGLKKSLRLVDLMNQGKMLGENRQAVSKAAESGLQVKPIESLRLKKGSNMLEKGLEYFLGQTPPGASKGPLSLKKIQRGMGYLHQEFIPNAKRVAFHEISNAQVEMFEKTHGRKASTAEAKKINSIVAEQINNVFGGQNWETSKFFKTARSRKLMRRVIAYPDWTISNIKQAMGAFKPGLAGQIGRRYMARYLFNNVVRASLMRAFMGSIYQKEDKSVGFDPSRGLKELGNVKMGEGGLPMIRSMMSWKIPQIDIKYGPNKSDVVQFGRHPDGTIMESHLGKQFLELGGYVSGLDKLVSTMYNKSTPAIQEIWKQLANSTPSEYGSFAVDATRKGGKMVAWQGEKGFKQIGRRALETAKGVLPFSVRGGMKQWIASAFGTFPISKETSLFKATPAIENALKDPNKDRGERKLNAIREKLKDNRVFDDDINRRIGSVRGQLFRDKYSSRVDKIMKIENPLRRERHIKVLKKQMLSDRLEPSQQSVNNIFTTAIKRLKREGEFTKDYAKSLLEERKSRRRRRPRRARRS